MDYFNKIDDIYLATLTKQNINIRFRIDLLDWTEENILKEITDNIIMGSGTLSINYQPGIRRTFSCDIANIDGEFTPSFRTGTLYATTKLKLYIGLRSYLNDDTYWFSQGVFLLTDVVNKSSGSNKIVTINAIDKFGIFGSELGYMQLQGDYKIEKETKIYSIIKDILSLDMENGYVIDCIKPFLDPIYKDEIMPYTLIKNKGEQMADVLITLANILGCNIYYDVEGVLTFSSGTDDCTYAREGVIYIFNEQSAGMSDFDLKIDYGSIVNSVTVVGTNVNDKVYSYTARNTDPFSPTRIEYVGLKECEPIESSMVYNEDRAKEYALYMLKRRSILQNILSFRSTPIPHLDVDKVIQITNSEYNFFESRFIIQSLQFPISTSEEITLETSNTAELPYFELQEGGSVE